MMNKKSTKDILQAPRGMRDFFGEEFKKKKRFFNTAESIAESYGFSGIETPVLEHTEIFNKGIGEGTDIIDKEMYNLSTLGGDALTLKPEGTAPVMRSFIEHGMGAQPQPRLLYYSSPFFRHDKPQKGRYRQFYQFGLEVMGSRDAMYDAMIIDIGYQITNQQGGSVVVKLNSLGTSELRKTYTEKLVAYYTKHKENLGERDQERITTNPFRVLDSKDEKTKVVNQTAPILIDHLDTQSKEHFNRVALALRNLNIPYVIDPFLVRGMDYYEHTVFEYILLDENGDESLALGGGGRYDGLAEMIGHTTSVPAVGLGLGVDRIIESFPDAFNNNQSGAVPLLITDTSLYVQASQLLSKIQSQNIFLYPLATKLSKQFARVQKEGYDRVYILGEDEINKQTLILKNLSTGEQKEISQESIIG
tara:strand:- start:44 stop:1300 length:1257 start_codon:yes stop_codon:yes gene_type:complete